jgi:head-tail adaptor
MPRISKRQHRVIFQAPVRAPDGEGGYRNSWSDLTPASIWVSIAPATAQTMERSFGGTIITIATHVVEGPLHPQVTTLCRMIFGGLIFQVVGVSSRDEAGIEMVLACAEQKV